MLTSTTHCVLSDEFFQMLKVLLKNTRAEEDVCVSNFPNSFRIYFFLKDIYIRFCMCTEQAVHKEWIQIHTANYIFIQPDENISDWLSKIFSSENSLILSSSKYFVLPPKKVFYKLEWFIVCSKV
jgi:hypothetical protein